MGRLALVTGVAAALLHGTLLLVQRSLAPPLLVVGAAAPFLVQGYEARQHSVLPHAVLLSYYWTLVSATSLPAWPSDGLGHASLVCPSTLRYSMISTSNGFPVQNDLALSAPSARFAVSQE